MKYKKEKPQAGEKHKAECVGLGTKGDGIFNINGFVIICKHAIVHRTYDIEITQVGERFGFGKILHDE